MAFVRVEQRNAHLAGSVRLEFVNGREGKVAKGTVTAISNTRRGSGEGREDEATAIQWTLWGRQAENAAEYLGKGSHVNIVGRLRNDNYEKEGETVYGMSFTAEEIDYLDSKASAEARDARRARQDGGQAQPEAKPADAAPKAPPGRRARGEADPRESTTACGKRGRDALAFRPSSHPSDRGIHHAHDPDPRDALCA